MSENEIVIPMVELSKVEVRCECGSGTVFAFNRDIVFTNDQRRPGQDPAQSCPSCNTHFGSSVIAALIKWHQLVSFAQGDAKFSLKFRVPQNTTKTSD